MRRLLMLCAGVAATALVAATAAGTTSAQIVNNWQVAITAAPTTVASGHTIAINGVLSNAGGISTVAGQTLTVNLYRGAGCVAAGFWTNWTETTDSTGAFSDGLTITAPGPYPRLYSIQVTGASSHGVIQATSNCVDLKVMAATWKSAVAPSPPSDVFLCYSAFQTNPGVWSSSVAAALLKAGYWSPYAVAGNVAGATNIGAYHLACNLATGQSAGTSTLGGAGEVIGADAKTAVTGVPGFYPIIGS